MNATQNITSFIGRILLSIIFIISGFDKLANHSGTVDYINSVGAPLPEVAYWIALFAEIGLGLALFVGFKARFAAIGLAGFTFAAALLFHSNFSDQIQMIMFMKNLTIIGGLLLVVAYGAGAFSLDNRQ
jgi:putative oxidoreductase